MATLPALSHIAMLLVIHYDGRPCDEALGHFQNSGDVVRDLENLGLVKVVDGQSWVATEKGIAMVEHIRRTPLPVATWSVPHAE